MPSPANGLRPWLDGCFDLLLINPFLDWQDPFAFVRLMAAVAARRPVLAVSDRDSLEERMIALHGGADDVVTWTDNLPEVLARAAGLLRRSRLAAGQLGAGELRIDLIDRRVDPAYESMFAIGVDEMSWDDLNDERYDWPAVEAVKAYRRSVRDVVDRLIRTRPLTLPIGCSSGTGCLSLKACIAFS